MAWLGLILAGCLALGMALAQSPGALRPVPPPALVSDQTGTLTATQLAELQARLGAFEQRKGSQVALLIVPSTQPEAIEPYALRVVEQWKLGRKKVDDGALLLVAKNDRTVRIEVGYGLEGVLSDAATQRIISESIVPRFREGDFYGGINGALERMMRLIDGEALAPAAGQAQTRPEPSAQDLFRLAPVLLVAVVVAGGVLRAAFGRLPGAALTAGGAGFIVWLLSGALGIAAFGAVLAFVATLLGMGSGHRSGLPGLGGGLHRGGGFGGGGLGGLGGGGFSGGGGGFGGGGSSGRW